MYMYMYMYMYMWLRERLQRTGGVSGIQRWEFS